MEAFNESSPFNFSSPPTTSTAAHRPALSIILVIMLLTIMLSLGCTMEFSKIKAHFWRPKGLAVALVGAVWHHAPHCLWTGQVLPTEQRRGPGHPDLRLLAGGNLSNIFTLAIKGDMNLR